MLEKYVKKIKISNDQQIDLKLGGELFYLVEKGILLIAL